MEVVMMPQLAGKGSGNAPSVLRYRLVEAELRDGTVKLADRAVSRFALNDGSPVVVTLPERIEGGARDFLARIEILGSSIPEISFVGSDGEEVKFEDAGVSEFACAFGTNLFAFTETAPGTFLVRRKTLYPNAEAR